MISYPFFPNGVIYGASIVLMLPFIWYARYWYSSNNISWWVLTFGLILFLLAVIFSYKRGAWITAFSIPFIVLLIRMRLFEKAIWTGLFMTSLLVGYLLYDNNYYDFAPIYKDTIFHEGNFKGHLNATFDGTELSAMERFNRWVAAKNMIAERPLLGFGPSTYSQIYKGYTDSAFRTYVSDNKEQSTTHNYFLMTFAEQGIIGGLLFLGLCIHILVKCEKVYFNLKDKNLKRILLMAGLSFSTIILHSILNEMIEVDKVGSMFWLNMVIIHKVEVWNREQTGTSIT